MVVVLLLCAAGAGQQSPPATWWQQSRVVNSRHYAIRSDVAHDALREIATDLDAAHDLFTQRLSSLRPRHRSQPQVLVFRQRDDYERTLLARFGVDARGTGGMFFVRGNDEGLALWVEGLPDSRLQHVIQHEGFHQFAFACFGADLPMWVNEGLAEYFGASVQIGRRLVPGQATAESDERIRVAVAEGRTLSFQRMLNLDSTAWSDALAAGDASILYDQAASMVRFLAHGDNGRYTDAFERYLHLLNDAVPSEVAFARAFGGPDVDDRVARRTIELFEEKWKTHAATASPPPVGIAWERLNFLGAALLELHRNGVRPESIEQFRDAVIEIGYTEETVRHGRRTVREAGLSDFELPSPAALEIIPAKIPRSAREKRFERTNPMPPTLQTTGVEPYDLELRWARSEDNTTFDYRIVALRKR